MEVNTIGFLGVYQFEGGAAIRGATLITDKDTKPIEFRVTAPIRPQSFQATLYGDLLGEHIAVDLIGMPLLNEVNNKPNLVLVCDEVLLSVNNKQDIPTLRIMRAEEPHVRRRNEPQILNSLDSKHPSAKFYTSDKFLAELPVITNQLQEIFLHRDLMEPFVRLARACADIHDRKLGEK